MIKEYNFENLSRDVIGEQMVFEDVLDMGLKGSIDFNKTR